MALGEEVEGGVFGWDLFEGVGGEVGVLVVSVVHV